MFFLNTIIKINIIFVFLSFSTDVSSMILVLYYLFILFCFHKTLKHTCWHPNINGFGVGDTGHRLLRGGQLRRHCQDSGDSWWGAIWENFAWAKRNQNQNYDWGIKWSAIFNKQICDNKGSTMKKYQLGCIKATPFTQFFPEIYIYFRYWRLEWSWPTLKKHNLFEVTAEN